MDVQWQTGPKQVTESWSVNPRGRDIVVVGGWAEDRGPVTRKGMVVDVFSLHY